MNDDRQTVTVKYEALNADGIKVVGCDIYLGLMKEADAKRTETVLLQTLQALKK